MAFPRFNIFIRIIGITIPSVTGAVQGSSIQRICQCNVDLGISLGTLPPSDKPDRNRYMKVEIKKKVLNKNKNMGTTVRSARSLYFTSQNRTLASKLEKTLRSSHGTLDVQRPHVLPVLLQQGYEEVHGQMDVVNELVFVHFDVTDSHVQAQDLKRKKNGSKQPYKFHNPPNKTRKINSYLLHLKLDGGLQVVDLLVHVVGVGQQGRELSSLVESGTQEPGDLLNQRFRCQEGVVLLGQLFDELLLLVELLEVIGAHEGYSLGLSLVAMLLIAEHADGEFGPGNMTQSKLKERGKAQN